MHVISSFEKAFEKASYQHNGNVTYLKVFFLCVFIYAIKTNVAVKIYVVGMQTLIKTDCLFYNTL